MASGLTPKSFLYMLLPQLMVTAEIQDPALLGLCLVVGLPAVIAFGSHSPLTLFLLPFPEIHLYASFCHELCLLRGPWEEGGLFLFPLMKNNSSCDSHHPQAS